MSVDVDAENRVRRAMAHFTMATSIEDVAVRSGARRRSQPRLIIGTAISASVAVVALAVLFAANVAAPQVAFADWSITPTKNVPGLAAAAQTECLGSTALRAPIVLQDQRGATAALLYVDGHQAVLCLASFNLDGQVIASSAASSDVSSPRSAFGLDGTARTGTPGAPEGVTRVFGHAPVTAQSVLITLADGETLEATSGDGWFLAWWPSQAQVNRIRSLNGSGAQIEVVEDPEAALTQ